MGGPHSHSARRHQKKNLLPLPEFEPPRPAHSRTLYGAQSHRHAVINCICCYMTWGLAAFLRLRLSHGFHREQKSTDQLLYDLLGGGGGCYGEGHQTFIPETNITVESLETRLSTSEVSASILDFVSQLS
jgi:hypothetical protein